MLYAVLNTVHVLAIVVWIGGMAFAHFCLRPALATLEPPRRTAMTAAVLGRFFGIVTVAAPLAWASGVWMLGRSAKQVVQSGGSFIMPGSWWVMAVLGTVMLAVYAWIRLGPYRALVAALAGGDTTRADTAAAALRRAVAVNLALGTAILLSVLLRWP